MSAVQNTERYAATEVANQASQAETAKKTQDTEQKKAGRITGRTIGAPKLSENAAKYYEQLKSKYGSMDFVLVSSDMKELAKSQAASFNNPHKMVVLIDEEKIERMAEDENFRAQYEGILNQAASGIQQLKASLGNRPDVKSYGVKINDGGTMSFFAVVDKSLQAQKKRIEKKAAEKKEAKKTEAKKAAKKEQQEKLEKLKAERTDEEEDLVTVTASSLDELLRKVDDVIYAGMSDHIQTKEEKLVGQHFDLRM
ncbi:MAG: hypothetical protein HDR26_06400 [Lachnospiraceae bacterium]|nr:hypothetical protein [Lachnospiraceae bacterium]